MTTYRLGYTRTFVEIPETARVLDVGSGHKPHPRANVLVDKFLEDDTHRPHMQMERDHRPLVVADAEALPFSDRSFDYVIASHVAEHSVNPHRFCNELMRVGCRGYIETPSKLLERLLNTPYHRWYVSAGKRHLLFELIPEHHRRNIPKWKRVFRHLYQAESQAVLSTNLGSSVGRLLSSVISWTLHKLFVYTRGGYTCFHWTDRFIVDVS